MEERRFKNVNNCLNTNIYSSLETPGGQSSNPYLNVDKFFNTSVNKTSVVASDGCFLVLISNTSGSISSLKWKVNILFKIVITSSINFVLNFILCDLWVLR